MVANAKQLNVDLAKAVCSEGASLNDGLFEWTASQAYIEFTEVSGDLSTCTELVVEALELTGAPFQIEFVLEDGTLLKGSSDGYWGPSTKNISLSDFGVSLNAVQCLRIVGESAAGTLKLGNIYLIEPLRLNFDETGKAYLYPEDLIDCTIGATMSEDGTITKTGTENASITLDFGDIDLSGITNIVADVDYTEDIMWRTLVINTDDQSITNENGGSGFYSAKYNISYSDFNRSQSGHISKVQYEFAAEKEGQIKFKSICFTSGFITAVKGDEVCLNDLPYYVKQSDGNFVAQANTVWNMNIATDIIYGDCNNVNLCKTYADVSEYMEVRLYSTSDSKDLRFWFFNADNSNVEVVKAQSVEGKDYSAINIEEVKNICGGKAYLVGAKAESGKTVYVTNIAAAKYSADADYNISGYGLVDASVEEVLKDAAATRIDVTGLENANPMTLTSVNPNCLFIASDAAKLTNTTNVLVANAEGGYTCADLSLDAAYPFKAPFDFVATTATVKKSVTEIGFATFVSPYNVAVPDGCEAYKIVSVDDADVLQCEPVEQIVANEPVLLVGEGVHQFTANSVAVSANTGTLVSGLLNGSYEATTASANSYVLQNQSGVTAFYRVAEDGKQQVVPFTAYLTLPAAAGANVRMLSIDLGSDATAIENVPSSVATVVAVYDLSGRSVEGLQRGINLVKMSDGTVKKVVVK